MSLSARPVAQGKARMSPFDATRACLARWFPALGLTKKESSWKASVLGARPYDEAKQLEGLRFVDETQQQHLAGPAAVVPSRSPSHLGPSSTHPHRPMPLSWGRMVTTTGQRGRNTIRGKTESMLADKGSAAVKWCMRGSKWCMRGCSGACAAVLVRTVKKPARSAINGNTASTISPIVTGERALPQNDLST